MTTEQDPLDYLPRPVLAFAERIDAAFDPGEVVTAARAAEAGGVKTATAEVYIARLREAKCWPYRSAKWRSLGWTFAKLWEVA